MFSITWTTDIDAVLAELLRVLNAAPDRLGSKVTVESVTPAQVCAGRECKLVLLGQLRGPQEELQAILAPVFAIAQPATSKIEFCDYWKSQVALSDDGAHGYYQERVRFVSGVPDAKAIQAAVQWARRGPGTSGDCGFKFFQVGGTAADNRLVVDAVGNPIALSITPGQAADDTQAEPLLEHIEAGAVLADKGYDSNALVESLEARDITPVIPSKANRKESRQTVFALCRERNLVERFFGKIMQYRGIAARYDKLASTFMAGVLLIRVLIWLN